MNARLVPRFSGPWSQLAILLLVSMGIRIALSPILMNTADRYDYISTAHKAMKFGIAGYYEPSKGYKGSKSESGLRGVPLPYPPIQIYSYQLAGRIYQRFFDSTFYDHTVWKELPFDSLPLNYLIKLPLFLFELLLTAAIFLFLRQRTGDRVALACAALYSLNPAVLYDGALWAQPDSIHSFFVALAVIALIMKKPEVSAPLLVLALLSKPQPVIFVPIVILLVLILGTVKQVATATIASIVTALLVLLPMLLQDPRSITNMLSVMSSSNTFVSANAHNFWWLIVSLGGGAPKEVGDGTIVLWGVSCFAISMLIVGTFYSGAAMGMIKKARERLQAEHFAYLGLVFFVFAVRMHENHAMQVLPLLLLSGLALRRQRLVFGVLSLTILANMMLHSSEIVGLQPSRWVEWARMMNSTANIALFGFWSYELYREFRYGEKSAAEPAYEGVPDEC